VVEAPEALLDRGDRRSAGVQRQSLNVPRSQPPPQLGDPSAGVGVGVGEEDRFEAFESD
jgi:hypothetical protein